MNDTKLVLRVDILNTKAVHETVYEEALFTNTYKALKSKLTVLGSLYFADKVPLPGFKPAPGSQFLAIIPIGTNLPIQPWFNNDTELGVALSCAVTHLSYWANGVIKRKDAINVLEQEGKTWEIIKQFREVVVNE